MKIFCNTKAHEKMRMYHEIYHCQSTQGEGMQLVILYSPSQERRNIAVHAHFHFKIEKGNVLHIGLSLKTIREL